MRSTICNSSSLRGKIHQQFITKMSIFKNPCNVLFSIGNHHIFTMYLLSIAIKCSHACLSQYAYTHQTPNFTKCYWKKEKKMSVVCSLWFVLNWCVSMELWICFRLSRGPPWLSKRTFIESLLESSRCYDMWPGRGATPEKWGMVMWGLKTPFSSNPGNLQDQFQHFQFLGPYFCSQITCF